MVSGYGIERSFRCHVHDDTNASASVNSVTGLWFCFSCHASGSYDLTTIELDPYQVKRSIGRLLERLNAETRVYAESWLDRYDVLGPGKYWLSRYSEPIARVHRLGQHYDGTYATIPFRDNAGRVLGVIRRDLTGLDPAKYRYPSGVEMANYLYNYHRVTGRTIVLTEGATDTIAAEEAGFPDAMAVYGSKLSREQVKLIHKIDPDHIIIAFDQDKAGHTGADHATWQLRQYPVHRLTWPRWNDLSSIPLPIRRGLLGNVRAAA